MRQFTMQQPPIAPHLQRNHDYARVIQVIETTLLKRGRGVEGDPMRLITQYWSLEGDLLAEVDPCKGE